LTTDVLAEAVQTWPQTSWIPAQTLPETQNTNTTPQPSAIMKPPGVAAECCWGEGCLGFSPVPVAFMTRPLISGRQFMEPQINNNT